MTVNLYLIGTAGCGKTTLTGSFKTWMGIHGFNVATVNLDPGVESLPYVPDIDIREWISLPEVMDQYGVGPNGAQVVAADLMAFKAGEVKKIMNEFNVDYFLIDTPGQMELFTLRESSKAVVDVLGTDNTLFTFLFDPVVSTQPAGFVSLLLLFASAWFRFSCPSVSVLSKADLLNTADMDTILSWSQEAEHLFSALANTRATMDVQMATDLLRALETMDIYRPLIPISSDSLEGMDDLYNMAQQIFSGGEDLYSD